MKIKVTTKPCIMCKSTHEVEVEDSDYEAWMNGTHAQDAFPYLSADDRELLISGTCPKCWDKLFG